MKVLGLISSPTDPASRARIIQYKNHFTKKGVALLPRFFSPLKDADPPAWSHKLKKMTGINEWRSSNLIKTIGRIPLLFSQFGYDIIWQNRLLRANDFFWETKLCKPVIFDFDDAIWLIEGEQQVIKKIKLSTLIFAGNDYLANFAMKYNKNTVIIPSTIDTEILYPLKKETDLFTIGWIGSKSNFKYLEIAKPAILNFLSQNNDSRLIVVSSEKPTQFNFDNNRIIFKLWNSQNENEMINEFSVGLMPLTDNDWTKGKCSYKMLQYMACGKPVVVSPVGMNKYLLNSGNIGFAATHETDWLKALIEIKNNRKGAFEKGENGRRIVEADFSCMKMTQKILEYFKSIPL
jgi:glycosyltransferase involved in cell wall biosynthesis